jgi:hypothetical protein
MLDVVLAQYCIALEFGAAGQTSCFFAARVKHWPASIRALDG